MSSATESPAAGLPFEVLEAKLAPPHLSRNSVARTKLVQQLSRSVDPPIIVVCAGPGYGKTTALAQWAGSATERPFAWVSVDAEHNDPVVLLTYVAAALHRIAPIDAGVFEALASPGASVETKVLPRLGAALAGVPRPLVLVLDDVHAIDNPRCVDAIVTLARHLAPGSQLVLCTRDHSALPMGMLRTHALTLELGPDELRMEHDEATALLSATPADFSATDVSELIARTEGWPAGLYLAGLSAAVIGAPAGNGARLTGNDPLVVDFLAPELLRSVPPDELAFLTQTSILEQLSGPLCDAVLAATGSDRMLESLARANRFVVALDRDRSWYRCHHLVRELLAAELERAEPGLAATLRGRAFDWCVANGHDLEAIRHAQADGDADRVAAVMERQIQPLFQSGRSDTVAQWLAWLQDHGDPDRYPAVAVIAALFHSVSGHPTQCDRWAAAAEMGIHHGPLPDGSASIDSWRALLRAHMARDGVEAMRSDASDAAATLAPGSPWHPTALLVLGQAELLLDHPDEASDHFADAAEEARFQAVPGATPIVVPLAMAHSALIAIARGEWALAQDFADKALWTARHSLLQDAAQIALVYAVAARTALHHGDSARATELVTQAQRRLPNLTYACPVTSAQTRMELARTYLALADPPGARTMLREVESVLRRCPDLGTLPAQVVALRAMLSTADHNAPGVSTLTSAELRVLPLLTTHLTFKEIGERLFISRHTVKSHAMSIYRKLNVTSRSSAVARAGELGLL